MYYDRAIALERRKHEIVGGFHKTVHIERIAMVGVTDYRKDVSETTFSMPIIPTPIVRITTEEDISIGDTNVSLGDYIMELIGDQLSEQILRDANQLVFNKGADDEERVQILSVRPSGWRGQKGTANELAVIGAKVIRWDVVARATKQAV